MKMQLHYYFLWIKALNIPVYMKAKTMDKNITELFIRRLASSLIMLVRRRPDKSRLACKQKEENRQTC